MKRSTLILTLMIAIDLFLLLGAWWLLAQVKSGAFNAPDPAEAIRRITTVAGGAIGLVTALFLMVSVMLRRQGN